MEIMNTLDKFGTQQLDEAIRILTAYKNAGEIVNGKRYNYLPQNWLDDGVYLEFNANSGLVFLVNSDYQSLVATEDGLLPSIFTPHWGHDGLITDVVEIFRSNCLDPENKPLPYPQWYKFNYGELCYLFGEVLSAYPAVTNPELEADLELCLQQIALCTYISQGNVGEFDTFEESLAFFSDDDIDFWYELPDFCIDRLREEYDNRRVEH